MVRTAVFIRDAWNTGVANAEEILFCFAGTTGILEITKGMVSEAGYAMLEDMHAAGKLAEDTLRATYGFIKEYCSRAEVSLRELRLILKNAGKMADEKLKSLTDWVRGRPEYYDRIEAEGTELLREEEAGLAGRGLSDKVDDILEEKCGKLEGKETLGEESVESAIEKAKNIAERNSHPCQVIKEGDLYTDYLNEAGTKVRVPKQAEKSIEDAIARKLESTDIGEQTEAKVADYIRKNTGATITDYANKIKTPQGNPLGDIDIATEKYWIEVKTSVSDVKPSQMENYSIFSNENYINVNNKDVILYIDEPIDMATTKYADTLRQIEEMGVTIVNGLEELGKVVK